MTIESSNLYYSVTVPDEFTINDSNVAASDKYTAENISGGTNTLTANENGTYSYTVSGVTNISGTLGRDRHG